MAAEVYAALEANGCLFDGDEFSHGSGWLSRSAQVFMLPQPDEVDGTHWFDADVIDDILVNRWLGFDLHGLKRH